MLQVVSTGANGLAVEARDIALQAQQRSGDAMNVANIAQQSIARVQQQSDARYTESQVFFKQCEVNKNKLFPIEQRRVFGNRP